MNNGKRAQILSTAGLLMFAATLGHADTFGALSSGFSFSDFANWNNLNGTPTLNTTYVPSPSTAATNLGKTVTINFGIDNAGALQGESCAAGANTGCFPAAQLGVVNDYLLYTHDPTQAADSITLSFLSSGGAISAFGVDVQDFAAALPFTATITTNLGGSVSVSSANGNPVFLGIQDTTLGGSFTSVTITVPVSTGAANSFAIDTARFTEGTSTGTSSTPEPASLMLMLTGMAGLVWKVRKRA